MTETLLVTEKISEVKEEMKRMGIWKNETPAWVKEYEKRTITTGEDFSEWLQFVYLPNRIQEAESRHQIIEKIYIVPQAMKFFGSDIKKGKLLQLLIELDSLS
ncbi:MAG: YqcC family protein [Bacteroidota bacterium]